MQACGLRPLAIHRGDTLIVTVAPKLEEDTYD